MADEKERLATLETKVDMMIDNMTLINHELKAVNEILAVQENNLRLHMEGVRLAREQNDILKKDLDTRLSPIEEHVIEVKFLAKLGKYLMPLLAFPAALYYIIQLIRIFTGHL